MTDRLALAREQLVALRGDAEARGAVHLRLDGNVARIVIDHPSARSSLTLSMMVELADAVRALRDWGGSLVVVCSTDPRAFCSGGHLGTVVKQVHAGDKARVMSSAMTVVLDEIGALPCVSVAAIDGIAMGGGAELACATDFRVASPEARIHFVHTRLGIAPGWGGAARLVRIVGRTAALRILTSARPIVPGEAAEICLVDHRSDGPAVDGALVWLRDLLDRPSEAIRAVKQQVSAAIAGDRAADVEAFVSVWGGPAHRAALARRAHPTDAR